MHRLVRILSIAFVAAFVRISDGGAQQSSPLPPGNITIVVPSPPGGPTDAVSRIFVDKLRERTGRVVVIENKGGAGGNIGAAQVARSKPDGLTWLAALDSVWTVNPHLGSTPNFDPGKDLEPAAQIGQFVLMLVVHNSVTARSWTELVDLSKTQSLSFGSAGVGAPGHLALEYLKTVAPFEATHVPYRGNGPLIADLVSGHIHGGFIAPAALLEHLRAGSVRGLAVSDTKRFPPVPGVPTAREAGLGDFTARFSSIVAVPTGTPDAVRAFIASEVKAILAMPDVQARLEAIGIDPLTSSEKEAREWLAAEHARWGKVIRERGIKSE